MKCHPWSHLLLHSPEGLWYPTPPTVLPGLWTELELMEQPMERGCRNAEALDCALSLSSCTAGSLPVLLQLLSSGCKYHLCLLQKGHRSGMILFQYLLDLPWTALNTWQKWSLKKLIFRNPCMLCSSQHWSRKTLETHWRRKEWCSQRRKKTW